MDKPVGHKYIPYGTPMHVAQLTLVLLKATFAELGDETYPFRYTQDFGTTGVVIDTQLNKHSEIYGLKPAIIVNRGPVNGQQIAVGDKALQNQVNNNSQLSALIQSSVDIKIISKVSSEVDFLSNEVFNFLLMSRKLFPQLLGLNVASPPSLSPIASMEQDDSMFYCVATMPFSMQYKWVHLVPQVILNNIGFYMNEKYVFNIFSEPTP